MNLTSFNRRDFIAGYSVSAASIVGGQPREVFYGDVDPQILRAVDRAHDVLSGLAASVDDVEFPAVPDLPIVIAEVFAYHEELIADRHELNDPITLDRVRLGANVSASNYMEARHQLELARNAIAQVFENVDLLTTPTVARLPVTIEAAMQPNGDDGLIRNTLPFNTLGIPSISLPCGFSREGLPIGLQISGPAPGEIGVLALAHAYEQVTDWSERVPQLD